MIGARVKRREDRRLLTGVGRYVDDVVRPGMLHAAIVRSPHAHAAIRGLDAGGAARVPGFVRCVTAADIGAVKPIPVRLGAQEAFAPYLQPPMAGAVARYAGEPVAMVLATSRYAAEDAAEAVSVDYEPKPPVSTPAAALDPAAAGRHPAGNVVARWEVTLGDVAAAFREAEPSYASASPSIDRPRCPSRRAASWPSSTAAAVGSRCGDRPRSRTSIARCSARCST
jgi:carbon-monoxide dehydrogenase large subunit